MNEKTYALFGIAGPLAAYAFIVASIALSPWFSWGRNALSDLGHAIRSPVAPIYNLGLFLAGFLMVVYSIKAFVKVARYTSLCLMFSSLLLQLVAVFDEAYGFLHYVVSVLFFISIGVASLAYAYERKSFSGVIAFVIGLSSWIIYWIRIYSIGVAVPETIASVAVTSWVVSSALKIYTSK